MKYAVIGTGKTGGVVLESLPAEDVIAVFNEESPVTEPKLKKADVGIVFVPGQPMRYLLPLLLDSGVPMVIGTTGCEWPSDLDAQLKKRKTPWIIGMNFSIGLNVMRHFAVRVKAAMNKLRPDALQLGITETHHIHKVDAPSGTAIKLAEYIDFPIEKIKAIREGEVTGTHTIDFGWPNERLSITHEAFNRTIYAEGVRLACEKIKGLPPGLHTFEKLADDLIETK